MPPGDGVGAFMRSWRELQGESEGETFLLFSLKPGRTRTDCFGMGKNTISTGCILLSLWDVIALSQFSLSLWEAVAFGALCAISYGIGLWTAFAE